MNRAMLVMLICCGIAIPSWSRIHKREDKDANLVVSTTPPPPGVASERREVGL